MTTFSGQLQLLLDQQQRCFKNSQLNFLENLRTRMINLPCFGDATEVGKFISHLQTELENNCRTYDAVYKSLCESRTTSDVNETVIHDPPSCPEMSNSETLPVVGSNPTVPETCTDSDVPSSQEDLLLNAHKLITVPSHKETGNKSCSILSLVAPNGPHHSTTDSGESYYLDPIVPDVTQNHRRTEFYIESTYPISNDNLPDIDSQSNAYDFDETSYNHEGNMSAESNDGRKSNLILLDIDFLNDSLSANEIHNEFENNELKSKVVHHHL
ncbi:unnamed protein product, partial [Schistosoma margrebowiei]